MANQYNNTKLLKQTLRGDLEIDIPKGFRSPLMTAIGYRQQTTKSINWMKVRKLKPDTSWLWNAYYQD